jgi:hypothetical protein
MSTGSGQATAREGLDRITGQVRQRDDSNMETDTPSSTSVAGTEQQDDLPNFGSARSDYGSLAYGGSLDDTGTGGVGIDDVSQGRRDVGSQGFEPIRRERTRITRGNTGLAVLLGAGVGVALMYLLDPQQGRRRRALLRDKLIKASNDASDAIGRTSRDLSNRVRGVIAETQKTSGMRRRESGLPGGGQGRIDEVGESGVYPVSSSEGASPDAPVHGQQSWGQGERGAAGYEDSGGSELTYLGEDLGVVGGATEGESGAYKRPK